MKLLLLSVGDRSKLKDGETAYLTNHAIKLTSFTQCCRDRSTHVEVIKRKYT
jgi:hypothetical protein